jgi:oxygen-independent coproporphyrinogen-3 oxidase
MNGFDPARGFGVYVHWPYCARICPYCDFNVVRREGARYRPLFDALLHLEGWRGRTGEREVLDLLRRGHAFADERGRWRS